MAVQLAAGRGATVVGTASARNHADVRELGAAEVVDYAAGDWVAAVRGRIGAGADALLEAYGGETKRRAPEALRDGGRLAWITGDPAPRLERGVSGTVVQGLPRRDTLDALTALIGAGHLRLPIERVYPLAEAAAAQERVAGGHVRGKLVIDLTAPTA